MVRQSQQVVMAQQEHTEPQARRLLDQAQQVLPLRKPRHRPDTYPSAGGEEDSRRRKRCSACLSHTRVQSHATKEEPCWSSDGTSSQDARRRRHRDSLPNPGASCTRMDKPWRPWLTTGNFSRTRLICSREIEAFIEQKRRKISRAQGSSA
jgi:hypothetical protein